MLNERGKKNLIMIALITRIERKQGLFTLLSCFGDLSKVCLFTTEVKATQSPHINFELQFKCAAIL